MSERYDAIMEMTPEDRVVDCGNPLKNRIYGIFVGFGQKFQDAKGWIDEDIMSDAEKEIMDLLFDIKNNKYDNQIK